MSRIAILLFVLLPILSAAQIEQDFELGTSGEMATMIWIDPGTYWMGAQADDANLQQDEIPRHQVTISEGFWIGKYEVTQAQWTAIMGDWEFWFEDMNRPAEMISWYDVNDHFLTSINDAGPGDPWRLPSEAEWEYVARAGNDSTRFWWGDDVDHSELFDYAWFWENNTPNGTKPVGLKQPNPWGLYDIMGNVWEMCEDWYGQNYYGVSQPHDPFGPSSGRTRVLRGGAWRSVVQSCRPADRSKRIPSEIRYCTGFRLVNSGTNEPAPLTIRIIPLTTTIPPEGGMLIYDAIVTNNTGVVQTGLGWTQAMLPNNTLNGPLLQVSFPIQTGTRTVSGLTQMIPDFAPPGIYVFVANIGEQYPGQVLATHSFEFEKLEVE
jgi:formylglycine-generating enzyme required for sulfatase activity